MRINPTLRAIVAMSQSHKLITLTSNTTHKIVCNFRGGLDVIEAKAKENRKLSNEI